MDSARKVHERDEVAHPTVSWKSYEIISLAVSSKYNKAAGVESWVDRAMEEAITVLDGCTVAPPEHQRIVRRKRRRRRRRRRYVFDPV